MYMHTTITLPATTSTYINLSMTGSVSVYELPPRPHKSRRRFTQNFSQKSTFTQSHNTRTWHIILNASHRTPTMNNFDMEWFWNILHNFWKMYTNHPSTRADNNYSQMNTSLSHCMHNATSECFVVNLHYDFNSTFSYYIPTIP